MPRAIATAQIAFGLVSIPVKLFSAAESSERINFNMIHKDCGSRIQQQLFCPKDVLPLRELVALDGFVARDDLVVLGTRVLLLEPRPTLLVQHVEGHARLGFGR